MEANACWWKRATHRLSASRSFRRCPFQRADHRNTLAGDTDPIAWHRYVPAETADLCRKQPNHTFFSPPHSDPSQDRTIWSFGRGMERGRGGGMETIRGTGEWERGWKRMREWAWARCEKRIHARDRACVRRKNEEDGRRASTTAGTRASKVAAARRGGMQVRPSFARYKRAIWKRGATPISFGRKCRPCQTPRPPSDSEGRG